MIPKLEDLHDILSFAKEAVHNGQCFFPVESNQLLEEFDRLNIGDAQEMLTLLAHLLEEIEPKNFVENPKWKASPVYTFVWESPQMKQIMLIKFALRKESFYYFSLQILPPPPKKNI